MRIFGQTGFHETKIADIATEAGVATGTLYNYFSSKEEIFQSILEDGRARLAAALAQHAIVEDPLTRLREVVRVMFEFLEEHGVLFTIYMQLGANPMDFRRCDDSGDEEFRQQLLGLIAGSIAEAGDRVRGDFPAQTLAWVFGGLMHGAITDWIVGGCQPGLRTKTDLIMEIFLNGATPR
ncbi:TetR family transcriptional regulator probably coupled to RND multidrug efflux transporter [Enhygromyxa salina]|uniref:TetR family transcriptional regulator probably coupled to RND multidrug efflux transporter n=2 Tax=Enhygromyxa salina TaxID=215803 RepID=A0A0C2CLE6_9BACT|nr:TetR family transcriptional regulator probably coupled to RND multidrug efflux transporter [Enhygromyxa salina]